MSNGIPNRRNVPLGQFSAFIPAHVQQTTENRRAQPGVPMGQEQPYVGQMIGPIPHTGQRCHAQPQHQPTHLQLQQFTMQNSNHPVGYVGPMSGPIPHTGQWVLPQPHHHQPMLLQPLSRQNQHPYWDAKSAWMHSQGHYEPVFSQQSYQGQFGLSSQPHSSTISSSPPSIFDEPSSEGESPFSQSGDGGSSSTTSSIGLNSAGDSTGGSSSATGPYEVDFPELASSTMSKGKECPSGSSHSAGAPNNTVDKLKAGKMKSQKIHFAEFIDGVTVEHTGFFKDCEVLNHLFIDGQSLLDWEPKHSRYNAVLGMLRTIIKHPNFRGDVSGVCDRLLDTFSKEFTFTRSLGFDFQFKRTLAHLEEGPLWIERSRSVKLDGYSVSAEIDIETNTELIECKRLSMNSWKKMIQTNDFDQFERNIIIAKSLGKKFVLESYGISSGVPEEVTKRIQALAKAKKYGVEFEHRIYVY